MKNKKRPASRPRSRARPSTPTLTTEANVPVELAFTAQHSVADPFNQVALDAVFTDPAGQEFRVPAFWAGGAVWKVRYASPLVGAHRFRTAATPAGDPGLHDVAGAVKISPYRGRNPVFAHGPLRVSGDRRHLQHVDGTPFFWLGDTWWMGLSQRLQWPDGFRRLMADRKRKGFTVVQTIMGLYPDMDPFDPRGANERGLPWEENYARIRPEYFDQTDEKIHALIAQGFVPCLVGAWGYFMPWMGVEKIKAHWRNLIARYGAWPVAWCIAGEANMPWYLAKSSPADVSAQVRDWTKVLRYVRDTDPFRRPLTIHPAAGYTSRRAVDDASLLDFDFLQTPHAQNDAVPITVRTVREGYADPLRLPVIDGEPCYEMLNGTITTAWPRRMFWLCLLNGAAGHTYGANGIWQCNQPGQPHGASPHGGNYGTITWEEAMQLAGSTQVGLGKKLLERYDWTRFRPHPEWAAFTGEIWLGLDDAKWLWTDTEKSAADAPIRRRYFRKAFSLGAGKVASARLRVVGANHLEIRLNGQPAGTCWGPPEGGQFDDLGQLLHVGRNVLAISVEYRPATQAPTGFLACLELRFADGKTQRIVPDENWWSAEDEQPGWDAAAFDDAHWKHPLALGVHGEAPWGKIAQPDLAVFGPQAAGIPGVVRVIYVPQSHAIVVRRLGAHDAYRAFYFNPVDGSKTKPMKIAADPAGEWRCDPPAGLDHDWVLVIEPVSRP